MYGRASFELFRKRVVIMSQSKPFTKIDEEPVLIVFKIFDTVNFLISLTKSDNFPSFDAAIRSM